MVLPNSPSRLTRMAYQMHHKSIKFEKASKLVDMWMDNMSQSAADRNEPEFSGRTGRVGLGIKIIPNDRASASADPVVRKLQGKLNASRRKYAKNYEEENRAEDNGVCDSEEDDEPESRIKALTKKRAHPTTLPQQCTKKIK